MRLGQIILPFLLLCALPVRAEQIVGGEFEYTVQPGDYLILIGARFGQDPRRLAQDNAVAWDALIHPGQKLRLNNRHIVPEVREDGILINVPQRMLYLFRAGKVVAYYPVGLGRPTWPTPLGLRTIRSKEIDKEWRVPPSIQEEMRQAGQPVLTRVPPGPDNPLGMHWMGLRPGWWGIHATNAPASVYDFRSHGCIRLHPDDAADLFKRVHIGDPVDIVYRPVLLARLADGAVYLEMHQDIYGHGIDLWQALRQAAGQAGLLDWVDWALASQAMMKQGVVTRVGPPSP